jgi:HprK-related kinase A
LKIHQLSLNQVRERLVRQGLRFPCGPFNISLRSNLAGLVDTLYSLYGDFPINHDDDYVDFVIELQAPNIVRRFFRPQVSLSCDGRIPFKPLPLAQAFPMLEWGLNWVISSHAHRFLVIHAAVVEKGGRALILAADPGSGKSTLCAALVHQGWRLLSDELALVELSTGNVRPIARPVSLKNASIDLVRNFGRDVILSPVCHDTAKGSIAHMKPPVASVGALDTKAMPAMVVFPKYVPGADLSVQLVGPAYAFLEIARHAFNLPVLAGDGFDAIARLVDQVRVARISYASFAQVVPAIEHLWSEVS